MTEILQTPKLVVVFGGSGFVGRHIVRALAKRGYRIRVPVRRPDLAGHLQPLGNVGQIQPVQANVRMRWSVDRAVQGADHVINLVAILHESGRQKFNTVHEFGARAVAEAARSVGAGLTHISALGADLNAESDYARTKALGEKAVLETIPDAVIFRPSINFGPEDSFFNRFADMARYSPVLPLIGGGQTKFQPVYVGDVAEAVARSVEGKVKGGQIYELGGPQVLTFKQCMEELLDRHRAQAAAGAGAVVGGQSAGVDPRPVAQSAADQGPGAAAARAQHRVGGGQQGQPDLAGLDIQPQSIGTILPSYLWRFRAAGQFQRKPAGIAN